MASGATGLERWAWSDAHGAMSVERRAYGAMSVGRTWVKTAVTTRIQITAHPQIYHLLILESQQLLDPAVSEGMSEWECASEWVPDCEELSVSGRASEWMSKSARVSEWVRVREWVNEWECESEWMSESARVNEWVRVREWVNESGWNTHYSRLLVHITSIV